jgi:hypothetical protein
MSSQAEKNGETKRMERDRFDACEVSNRILPTSRRAILSAERRMFVRVSASMASSPPCRATMSLRFRLKAWA